MAHWALAVATYGHWTVPTACPPSSRWKWCAARTTLDVHLTFSQPFEGIVSSKGQHGDPRCVYVPPSTGQTFFSFRIAYARCGTKPDLHGQFYENTVVVQYDKDLLEVWDEAKRLRYMSACDYLLCVCVFLSVHPGREFVFRLFLVAVLDSIFLIGN